MKSSLKLYLIQTYHYILFIAVALIIANIIVGLVKERLIVNFSLNQTLRRTVLTSVSTFFAVLAIILLGGQILRGFAMIMALGVLIGTYSSIYVASAGMLAIGVGKVKEEETPTHKT